MSLKAKAGVLFLALFIVGGYWWLQQRGEAGTTIDLTLTTNPDLERGLVGHWTFDGPKFTGTTVLDSSATGANGGVSGTPATPVAGAVGQAINFRPGGWVNFVGSPVLGSSTVITYAAWVKTNGDTSAAQTVLLEINASRAGLFLTDDTLTLRQGGGVVSVDSGVAVPVGRWVHIAAVATNATTTFYIDGVRVAVKAGGFSPAPNAIMRIGGADGSKTFNGAIDDVRIYTRALSDEEIRRLYQLGATTRIAETIDTNPNLERGLVGHWTFDGPDVDWGSTTAEIRDVSGNRNNGNALGTLSVRSPTLGVHGQAIYMNGISDYISIADSPSLNATSAISIAFWTNFRTSVLYTWPIQKGGYVSNGWDLHLNQQDLNLNFRFPGSAVNHSSPGNTLRRGEWIHVTVTFDDVTDLVNFYTDGRFVGSVVDTGQLGTTTQNLWVGYGGANYFPGTLDDVRIYNRALSAEEVKRLYQLGATTRIATTPTNPTLDSGLVAHYTFDGPNVDWGSTTAEIRNIASNNYHGDAQGGMSAALSPSFGTIGQAMKFDGTANLVQIPGKVDNGSSGTITAWFNLGELTSSGKTPAAFVSYGGQTIAYAGKLFFGLTYAPPTRLNIRQSSEGDAVEDSIHGGTSLSANRWYHAALVSDGSTYTMYLNGVPETLTVYSGSNTGDWFADTTVTGAATYLANARYGGVNHLLRMQLDDVRIYNRALSAEEVKRLYEMGR